MQFQLTEIYRYWWPVTVRLPDPDPARAGQIIEQQFHMQFEALDQNRVLANQEAGEQLSSAAEFMRHERDQLHAVCRDWDVCDGHGAPVPFDRDNLEAALCHQWFMSAVWAAYSESLRGEAARLGNSPPPPAPGLSGG